MFTHFVLFILDLNKETIEVSTRSLSTWNSMSLRNSRGKEKSFGLAVTSPTLAKNIRAAMDALLSEDIAAGSSSIVYTLSSLTKVIELCNFYQKYLTDVKIFRRIQDIDMLGVTSRDVIDATLAFYEETRCITDALNNLIDDGAVFKKNKKAELFSIIYDKNLHLLDELKVSWAYNKGNDIVIDYQEILKWKASGLYPEHRMVIELQYFT